MAFQTQRKIPKTSLVNIYFATFFFSCKKLVSELIKVEKNVQVLKTSNFRENLRVIYLSLLPGLPT